MSVIANSDAPETNNMDLGDTGAASEFFKRLMPADAKDKPSENEEKEEDKSVTPDPETEDDESAEKPDDESDDEGSEKTKDDDEASRKYAEDDVFVKVKVGDEEHAVPVKDLSRLYGQEKALTQKSMEVAEQRKAVEAELAKNVTATAALLERAKSRFEPYSKIDFLLAAKELSAEDYTNLRTAAQAAYEDVQFLETNLNGFMQAAQEKQHESLITQARDAIKVLTGPVDQGGIEGWNEKLYDDIRAFAQTEGLRKEIVDNLVDPTALRLLHNAMLYARGKSKVITKVVNKTPTKVIKTSRTTETGAVGDKTSSTVALKTLRKTGTTDAAADAFMARWADRDTE